jgi:hypothetical protein
MRKTEELFAKHYFSRIYVIVWCFLWKIEVCTLYIVMILSLMINIFKDGDKDFRFVKKLTLHIG